VLRLFQARTRTIADFLGFRLRHLLRQSRWSAFKNLLNLFRVGLWKIRFKMFLVLFHDEITETVKDRSEVIKHVRRAEAVSRSVVGGLHWVLNNEHLLLVGVRQNII
jgi:hypothetical protein